MSIYFANDDIDLDLGFSKSLIRISSADELAKQLVPALRNIFTDGVTVDSLLSGQMISSLTVATEGFMQSENYVAGSTGWKLTADTCYLPSLDLSGYLLATGGAYKTAATGSRVEIFPDANTGIIAYDDSDDAVFTVLVGGDDKGDVIFGSSSKYVKWDKSAGTISLVSGTVDGTTTIDSRLASTLASAIDASGHFIDANLNTSAKTILGGFTFSPDDYSGAFKTGDVTWNTTTGAITGGTGFVINKYGIIGASGGVAKVSILSDGNVTFAGTLSAASGTLGTITSGTIQGCEFRTAATGNARIAMGTSGSLSDILYLNSSNNVISQISFGADGSNNGQITININNSSGNLLSTLQLTTSGQEIIPQNGSIYIGTSSKPFYGLYSEYITAKTRLSAETLVLPTTHTPSSASDTGTKGTICQDANYIYVCVDTNTWKRVAIASW